MGLCQRWRSHQLLCAWDSADRHACAAGSVWYGEHDPLLQGMEGARSGKNSQTREAHWLREGHGHGDDLAPFFLEAVGAGDDPRCTPPAAGGVGVGAGLALVADHASRASVEHGRMQGFPCTGCAVLPPLIHRFLGPTAITTITVVDPVSIDTSLTQRQVNPAFDAEGVFPSDVIHDVLHVLLVTGEQKKKPLGCSTHSRGFFASTYSITQKGVEFTPLRITYSSTKPRWRKITTFFTDPSFWTISFSPSLAEKA